MMTYLAICPFCGKETELEIDFDGYIEWQSGALVQNAFPELSPSKREVLISGICPKCQEGIFGE